MEPHAVNLKAGLATPRGAYLAKLQPRRGYPEHGLKRRALGFNTSRSDHQYEELHVEHRHVVLHCSDMPDSSNLIRIVQRVQPDEIDNLVAQSHVQVSFEEPKYTANADGLIQEMPQKETPPFYPLRPYVPAKFYSNWITVNYRRASGRCARKGILFNGESPLHAETFVTRKMKWAIKRIAHGPRAYRYLGNVSALRDWTHARDDVDVMWLMLQEDQPEDFVIARLDPRYYRPTGSRKPARRPEQGKAQARLITDHDAGAARGRDCEAGYMAACCNSLAKEAGLQAYNHHE